MPLAKDGKCSVLDSREEYAGSESLFIGLEIKQAQYEDEKKEQFANAVKIVRIKIIGEDVAAFFFFVKLCNRVFQQAESIADVLITKQQVYLEVPYHHLLRKALNASLQGELLYKHP